VAGAELVLAGVAGGEVLRERWGRRSSEQEAGEAAGSPGPLMEGSETLLEKRCSWPEAWEELWSELEERLSTLSAGEGEQEEGRE